MGLVALGGLALMTTSDYFLKSRVASDSRSAHTDLRNLVQLALAQKTRVCSGGPATCRSVNNCRSSLKDKSGGALLIPAAKIQAHAPLTEADNVELGVYMDTTPIIRSGNASSTTSAREKADHQRYKILLVGNYKSDTATSVTYSGSVEIIADRTQQGRSGSMLRASLPLDFTMDSGSGAFEDCSTRPTERVIAGSDNTVNSCLAAGGIPVPTSIGMLCRFRAPMVITFPQVICPPGFIGDPYVACTLDQSADSPLIDSIPACPTVAEVPSGCDDGFYRSAPGTASAANPCTACTTPAVPNGAGVLYTSSGARTAATDCSVSKVSSCGSPYHLGSSGKTCLPPGCALAASITTFSSPTGVNPKAGSIKVSYNGQTSAVTATISSPGGAVATVSQTGSYTFFSNLPQGDYTVVVHDPNPVLAAGCTVTLAKTLRVGGFFPDPVMNKGSLYCNYQGYPGGTPAPVCPLDPVDPEDLADPDYEAPNPPSGWGELSYDAKSNLRKCQYPFVCNSPDITRVDAPPVGDGKTPSCYRVITECPNTDPPTYPAPWLKISSSPLKCKLNVNAAPPSPTPAMCPAGFAPVLNTSPGIAEWVNTAGVPKLKLQTPHILCH